MLLLCSFETSLILFGRKLPSIILIKIAQAFEEKYLHFFLKIILHYVLI